MGLGFKGFEGFRVQGIRVLYLGLAGFGFKGFFGVYKGSGLKVSRFYVWV